jgi:hypothetical protein
MKMNVRAAFPGRKDKDPMEPVSEFDIHPKYDALSKILYKLFHDDPEFYNKLDKQFKNRKEGFKETLFETIQLEFKKSVSDLKISIEDRKLFHKDEENVNYLETNYSLKKEFDNFNNMKSQINEIIDLLDVSNLSEEDVERAYKYAAFMYDFDKSTSWEIYKQHHRK